MRPRWKFIGLAGMAGVAATGAVLARNRRVHRDYHPDELRDRLHRRLAQVSSDGDQTETGTGDPSAGAEH